MPLSSLKKIFHIGRLVDKMYNRAVIYYEGVEYATYPQVMGKLKLQNNGAIHFGRSVHFNSALTSNYVGLFKPCTIAVTPTGTLTIGDYSGFSGVSIYCVERIRIGKFVNCGGNVCIWDTDFHPIQFEERRTNDTTKIKSSPIEIADDVFIGANSIILKGVSIGPRSVIGAGSVVTKDVPGDEVWAGNPARFIKKINNGSRGVVL